MYRMLNHNFNMLRDTETNQFVPDINALETEFYRKYIREYNNIKDQNKTNLSVVLIVNHHSNAMVKKFSD